MLDNDTRIKNMREWYNQFRVQYNIIKYTYNRECSFLVPSYETEEQKKHSIRMLKIHSAQHLQFLFNRFKVYERQIPYNLYVSVAKFQNGIPNQDFTNKMINRDNSDFFKKYSEEMIEYDFILDIDARKHEYMNFAKETAIIISELFFKFDIDFDIRFSGRGFHLYIPLDLKTLDYSTSSKQDINIYTKFSFLRKMLREIYSEIICEDFLYIPTAILKIPFTISNYIDSQYVCFPLSRTELEYFELEKYNIKNQDFTLDYAMPIFNLQKNSENFKKMFDFVFEKFNDNILNKIKR